MKENTVPDLITQVIAIPGTTTRAVTTLEMIIPEIGMSVMEIVVMEILAVKMLAIGIPAVTIQEIVTLVTVM